MATILHQVLSIVSQIGLAEIGIRWEGDDSYEFDSHLQYSVVDGIYPFDTAFQKLFLMG